MLTLESFKLLNPKVASMEQRIPGGRPEVTFQEVCDLLSRCPRHVSVYARFNYALDDAYFLRLVDTVTDTMVKLDQKRKRPLHSKRVVWFKIVRMTLVSHRSENWLTRTQKRFVSDVKRWTKRHEEAHVK